jgi:hypothetical protein
MKARILFVFFVISAVLVSCKLKDSNDLITDSNGVSDSTGGTVTFKGQVYDYDTGLPIVQAVVRIVVNNVNKGSVTDSSGIFNFSTTVASSNEYPFITSKEGYYPDTLSTFAIIGKTMDISTIRLLRKSTTIDPSGNAASIVLKSQSLMSVGIKGSGSAEASNLIFEVQDANGKPVDANHAVTLNFRIGSSPGSEEYVYPASIKTNAYGLATATLNSGTKAGVVQVIAETTVSDKLISSAPVAVAIYGGFPNINHFIVACPNLNYPYLNTVGNTIEFSAHVGDKYSNPVRPGTTVYFKTMDGYGNIVGSAQTNTLGIATVIMDVFPYPIHSTLGAGFFDVTAYTVDESNVTIYTSTTRLLTGKPGTLTVTPTNFNIANGGSQEFSFTLTDELGHPMAPGTTVSISTDGGSAKLSGSYSFTMPDAMGSGSGTTNFSFKVSDGNIDELKFSPLTITISVDSPRGKASVSIEGTIN